MPLRIGADASCSDGACGQVSRIIVNSAAREITHLAVEPRHRHGPGRLVPVDLVDATTGQIQLRCTLAEFQTLRPAPRRPRACGTSTPPGTSTQATLPVLIARDAAPCHAGCRNAPLQHSAGPGNRVRECRWPDINPSPQSSRESWAISRARPKELRMPTKAKTASVRGKITSPTPPGRSAKPAGKRSRLSRLPAAVAKRSGRTTSAPSPRTNRGPGVDHRPAKAGPIGARRTSTDGLSGEPEVMNSSDTLS